MIVESPNGASNCFGLMLSFRMDAVSRFSLGKNLGDAGFDAFIDPAIERLLQGATDFGVLGGDVVFAVLVLGNVVESIVSFAVGSGGENELPIFGAQHAFLGINEWLFKFGPQHEVVVVLIIDVGHLIHRRQSGAFDALDAKLNERKSGFGIKRSGFRMLWLFDPRPQTLTLPRGWDGGSTEFGERGGEVDAANDLWKDLWLFSGNVHHQRHVIGLIATVKAEAVAECGTRFVEVVAMIRVDDDNGPLIESVFLECVEHALHAIIELSCAAIV